MAGTRSRGLGIVLVAMIVVVIASVAAACGGSGNSNGEPSRSPSPAATATPRNETGGRTPSSTATPVPTATRGPSNTPVPTASTGPMDGPASSLPTEIKVEARDNVFARIQPSQGAPGTIEAPANSEFSVDLTNKGAIPHNIAFFTRQGGTVLARGASSSIILGGESTGITFTTPAAGKYYFQCTVHPQEMYGDFIVK